MFLRYYADLDYRAIVGADWRDVERRAGRPTPRRRFVLAGAFALAVVFVAVAIARSLGGFDDWISGQPGTPAPKLEQSAFDKATRSWVGFPANTQLRRLAQTRIGGATYTLDGFRGEGTLCLRLVVSGSQSAHELACLPLSQLRTTPLPALVVVADYPVGEGRGDAGPSFVPPPAAAVTYGIVADGVEQVSLSHSDGSKSDAIVSSDAFLSVDPNPSAVEHVDAVSATAGKRTVAIPFAPVSTFFGTSAPTGPALSPRGPSKVQRVIHGGTIGWLAHRQPRGVPVPKTVHHIVGVLPEVIFAREIAPNPNAPERMVISVFRPPGYVYFAGALRSNEQVCAEPVGGRFGAGGGCWPASLLFSTAPFKAGISEDQSSQYVTLAGIASDDVARLRLYLATGRTEPVPLHDNGFISEAAKTDYPLRLVGYDKSGQVIGVITYRGDNRTPLGPQPVAGAAWSVLIKNSIAEVWQAPSTTGGTCTAIRFKSGVGQTGCQPPLSPDQIQYGGEADENGVRIIIRSGSKIRKLILHLRTGGSRTLTPIGGIAVAAIPGVAKQVRPIASVTSIEGLDAKGKVIVREKPGTHR